MAPCEAGVVFLETAQRLRLSVLGMWSLGCGHAGPPDGRRGVVLRRGWPCESGAQRLLARRQWPGAIRTRGLEDLQERSHNQWRATSGNRLPGGSVTLPRPVLLTEQFRVAWAAATDSLLAKSHDGLRVSRRETG
jgi:hypothetical protein